jgi:hypothetical protein
MKNVRVSVWIVCASLIGTLAIKTAVASGQSLYSGDYADLARSSATRSFSTLKVNQTSANIEITRTELGKTMISHCPLDDWGGEYTGPGFAGKCRAFFKGKYLVIESDYVQPKISTRIHRKERWQLSADSKILTIKSIVYLSDFRDDNTTIPGPISQMRTYTRTEIPQP